MDSRTLILFAATWLTASCGAAAPNEYFKIQVVDDETGRGVPLVELRTVHNVCYYTDSAGIAAFCEPGLMGQSVFFYVRSHGYEFPKDGFGMRGKALPVVAGGSAELRIKRVNIAERLYRVTGGGVYRDSALVGEPAPVPEPLLNAQVLGSDSTVNALYRGKVYWFWGDTNRPSYPLGNFHVPGAVSELPGRGGLDPSAGVALRYFVGDEEFAKPTAQMPGEGPTWIDALTVLVDKSGRERLYAQYVKVRGAFEVYQRGLLRFDDDKQQFEKVAEFAADAPLRPGGHPMTRQVDGVEYVYFAEPFPLVRVRATPESFCGLDQYESFTCWKKGAQADERVLDFAADGSLNYAWRRGLPPLGPHEQEQMIKRGQIKRDDALLQLRDVQSGEPIELHRGSAYWNEFRRRFTAIAVQIGGTSQLGEVWFAEADTPLGPWVYARKIVTHDRYSFYNPKQHPMFDADGGRTIYFEGTYTATFSGNDAPTPRYDYNQVMYRLDLADERLSLPAPVYDLSNDRSRFGMIRHLEGGAQGPIVFYAPDRPFAGGIPIYQTQQGLQAKEGDSPRDDEESAPLFFALPASLNDGDSPPGSAPLWEYVAESDGRAKSYSLDSNWRRAGYRRAAAPVCRVWRGPARELPRR